MVNIKDIEYFNNAVLKSTFELAGDAQNLSECIKEMVDELRDWRVAAGKLGVDYPAQLVERFDESNHDLS